MPRKKSDDELAEGCNLIVELARTSRSVKLTLHCAGQYGISGTHPEMGRIVIPWGAIEMVRILES